MLGKDGYRDQHLEWVIARRKLLIQIEDAHFARYTGGLQEVRRVLLEANRWLRTNLEDQQVREARDQLRQTLLPNL